MTTYETVAGRHHASVFRAGAPIYFLLTFAISWVLVVAVVGIDGFPGTAADFRVLLPIVVLAMLAGPSVAGIVSTRVFEGSAGLHEFKSRLLNWRVSARWYALATLIAPITALTVLTILSLSSPVYQPGIFSVDHPASHLMLGVMTGVAAGLFEELGWTGFAVPRLRRRYSVFATGLIVGLLWGAWHLLAVWWGSTGTSGSVSMALYLPAMTLSFLPPYRILMVWVYNRTHSLLVAMLMHASLTASLRILDPVPISGPPIVTYNLVLGGVLWLVVGAFYALNSAEAV